MPPVWGSAGWASVMVAGFLAAQPARIRTAQAMPAERKYTLLMTSSTRLSTRRADHTGTFLAQQTLRTLKSR